MSPETLLELHQLRKTDLRKNVLEIFLFNRGKALSNSDLEIELESSDRITLYRTLCSFEERGLIHQATDSSVTNKYALCDESCSIRIHNDKHAHFHCEKCGETICLYHALNN